MTLPNVFQPTLRPSAVEIRDMQDRTNQRGAIRRALAEPPVGSSVEWNGRNDPPDGKWMIEDGRLLTIAVYPDLYEVLGGTWNTGGEPAGTFRIPDSRGRTTVGAGQGAGLTDRPFGSKFGSETHTLSVAQMPGHNHGNDAAKTNGQTSDHTHDHAATGETHSHADSYFVPYSRYVDGGNRNNYAASNGGYYEEDRTSTHDHGHDIDSRTHHHIITAQGGNQPHNNVPPSIAKSKIIRVLI